MQVDLDAAKKSFHEIEMIDDRINNSPERFADENRRVVHQGGLEWVSPHAQAAYRTLSH